MQGTERFAPEKPWLGGVAVVAVLAILERVTFQAGQSENTATQHAIDGLLLYGSLVLGVVLPILAARASRGLPSRTAAWARVLAGSLGGSIAMLAVTSLLTNNIDGGLALMGLPIVALVSGAIGLVATGNGPR